MGPDPSANRWPIACDRHKSLIKVWKSSRMNLLQTILRRSPEQEEPAIEMQASKDPTEKQGR